MQRTLYCRPVVPHKRWLSGFLDPELGASGTGVYCFLWSRWCAGNMRQHTEISSEKHPKCQQDCECAGGCCDYQVQVGRCFSVRGDFLDEDQRVYVEQLLLGLKTVLQLVQVVDLWCERLFNAV